MNLGMRAKRPVAVMLAAAAIAALAGCANPFGHTSSSATEPKAAAATTKSSALPACTGQAGWNLLGDASVKAFYADTGALSADASAGNQPGVTKAGSKLAADALAAATLPLPPIDASSWKILTADYAAAGTAIAAGDTTGAVPQLEAGDSAISSFTSAVAKCLSAKS